MDKFSNFRSSIRFSYSIIWIFICSIILSSCGVVEVRRIDKPVIVKEDSLTTVESVVITPLEEPEPIIEIKEYVEEVVTIDSLLYYKNRIISICDSLEGDLEITSNYSNNINKVLSFSNIPLKSAYCGATVYYILTKAGLEYNVKNPEWASNNFIDKSKVVFQKGKRLSDEEFKVGYVTGYRLGNTNRINHVGLLIKENETSFYVFEGNTTNPSNRNEQGFFYKVRKADITYIRKSY